MEFLQQDQFLDNYPIRQFRLENGLRTMLIHNPISPVAACMMMYTVGSASELDHQRGLAHFFEHMMFRETENLGDGDYDRIISEIGGVGLNAFTSFDVTAYHVSIPSASLGRVIELEADRMANLRLSEDLIERERGAVLGELKMYKDIPSEQVWDTLMASSYSEHPYQHPIIGYEEKVEGFGPEDFQKFYQAHYAPNRAWLVIVGDFQEQELLDQIEGAFGGIAPGEPLSEASPPEGPWEESKRIELEHEKITSDSLTIAFRSPGITHPDMPALLLLSAILSGGHSSPLHLAIVPTEIGTHISANFLEPDLMMVSPGLFVIEAGLQQGVPAEKAESAVNDVLKKLHQEGIPQEEIDRGKNQTRLSFYSGLRGNMSLARIIAGYNLVTGDPRFAEKVMANLAKVTQDELATVLEKYLIETKRLTLVQRPSKRQDTK